MQILSSKSVTGVLAAFLFLFLVASISGTNYTPNKIIQNAIATNGTTNTKTTSLPSTNGSYITLGSPQHSYTEYDKTTCFKPAIVNGTHGIQFSFYYTPLPKIWELLTEGGAYRRQAGACTCTLTRSEAMLEKRRSRTEQID
jgi:hypothetical protein